MNTPEMDAAYAALKQMDADILRQESNLRVLEKINASSAMELRTKLATSRQKRMEFMSAIEDERNRGD